MIFDESKYKYLGEQYVCMHCGTVEKARVFLDYLHGRGYKWINGLSYKHETNFSIYGENTVYYFLRGTYGSNERTIATVLEFDDFDWGLQPEEYIDAESVSQFIREVLQ